MRAAPAGGYRGGMNEERFQPLADLSRAFSSLVAATSGPVVEVAARSRRSSSGVVWSADGLIVTVDHAIEREEPIVVGLADGRRVPAALLGRDPRLDLALLRAEATGLPTPVWSDLEDLAVGQLTVAVSRPGVNLRAVHGMLSDLREAWRTPWGGRVDRYLQTDIGAERGFSGSLLVDAAGAGLGLNTAGLLRGRSLTLPAATLARFVKAVLSHGRVPRAYLGLSAHPGTLPAALAEGAGQRVALVIVGVEAGGPAEQGGLLVGDALLSIAGQPTSDLRELQTLLEEETPGHPVAVRFVRAGEERELTVTLGGR